MGTFSRGTSLDPWFVTGFAEGEAAFTYSRSGRQMALYFAIKLTNGERPLLEEIQAFFGGIGKIYSAKARPPTPRSGFTKSAAYFRVCRREELRIVLSHFDQYPLRGSKAGSYAIWRQMVVLKQRFRQPDREQLQELAVSLSSASLRNKPWM